MTKISENVFDGDVYSSSIDNIDKVFLNNISNFTDSGIDSFFKTCKIPKPSFFIEKPRTYIQDTFLNQKSNIRELGDILFLVRDDKIVYSARKHYDNIIDPKDNFSLMDWTLHGEDLNKGFRRYVYESDKSKLELNQFTNTAFLNVPILYHSSINIEIGLFRKVCSNGLVTQVDKNNVLKVPRKMYDNFLMFDNLLQGIVSGLISTDQTFEQFLGYLENKELPDFDRIRNQLQILKQDKVISKEVEMHSSRHIDLIQSGQPVTDNTLPSEINTLLDLTNLLTRFSQESSSFSMQIKHEKNIFNYMYEQYLSDENKEIQPLNLNYVLDNLKKVEV